MRKKGPLLWRLWEQVRIVGGAEPSVCSSRLDWVRDHPEGRLQKSTGRSGKEETEIWQALPTVPSREGIFQ